MERNWQRSDLGLRAVKALRVPWKKRHFRDRPAAGCRHLGWRTEAAQMWSEKGPPMPWGWAGGQRCAPHHRSVCPPQVT